MPTYKEFFGCRYPILAVAMNQVSNVDLAISVAQAGGFPSISLFNFCRARGIIDWDFVDRDFQRYQNIIGNCNFVLSLDTEYLKDAYPMVVAVIKKFKISHVEMICVDRHKDNVETFANINQNRNHLQDMGVKLILKAVAYPSDILKWATWDDGQRQMDAVGLKGPGGAGRVMETNMTLEEMVIKCLAEYPDLPVISVGGIGNSDDVKQLMELGVMAVGVGTLFAAAKESPVSEEAKQKMIDSSAEHLTKLNTDSLKQNSLKFGEFDQLDNDNNTMSLRAGIKDGKKGHIFAGHGISAVKEILPVSDIIQNLFKGNNYQ
jgi:NAD(P)H-dependent flavin oxidoreductase YrpB (nitropropane dioxygenase family)